MASSAGTHTYTYDAENQLVSVEQASSWKLEYTYNGRQRLRIVKDYEYSGGGYTLRSETRYLYDGMLLLQERNSSGHPTVTYTRGRDLSGTFEGAGGIGGLLTRSTHATSSPYQPNSHAFYQADGNGNVTYLLRSDGTSYAAYKYDPFGRTLSSAGTLASGNLLRFSSKLWSQSSSGSTGLYYYGYRFYDPTSQRWPNRDPIGERGGLNLYGFVGSNPIGKYDPLGNKEVGLGWGGAIGGMAGFFGGEASASQMVTTGERICVTLQGSFLVGGGLGGYASGSANGAYTPGVFGGPGGSVGIGAFGGALAGGGIAIDGGVNGGSYDGSIGGAGGSARMGPTLGEGANIRLTKACTGCALACEAFAPIKAVARALKCLGNQL